MMNEKLNSDWLFRIPIDFEYNKYIALNYIKAPQLVLAMCLHVNYHKLS